MPITPEELIRIAKSKGIDTSRYEQQMSQQPTQMSQQQSQPETYQRPQGTFITDLLDKISPKLTNSVIGAAQGFATGQPPTNYNLDSLLKQARIQHLLNPASASAKSNYVATSDEKGGYAFKQAVDEAGNPITGSIHYPSQGMFGAEGVLQLGNPQTTGDEYLASLRPQDQRIIKGLANYDLNPTKDFAGIKGAAARAQYIAAAKQYDPSYDDRQFDIRNKYLKDFTSGKRAANVLSANTALKHVGSLQDTFPNLPSSGIEDLEKLERLGTKKLLGSSPASLAMTGEDIAIHAITGELSNIFKQSGGTDVEIGNFLTAYNPNSSTEAKISYIHKAAELLQGRISAIENEYEKVMGHPYGKSLINPDAQSVLDSIYGGQQNNQNKESDPFAAHLQSQGFKIISKRPKNG